MRQIQSGSIAKLSDALAKAQAETQHAAKTSDNPFYKSKYADLPAVIDAARIQLSKNGLSVTQITDFDETGIMLITQLSHSSGEWIRGYYPVRPTKNDPQGLGSALTYARRYAYQSVVGIASSADDDDGNAASNIKPESAASRNRRFKDVLKAIAESSDPAVAWEENLVEITEFKNDDYSGVENYDTLVMAGAKRKEELKQLAALKAGMPSEFNSIGAKQ